MTVCKNAMQFVRMQCNLQDDSLQVEKHEYNLQEHKMQFCEPRWHMNKYSLQKYEVQFVKPCEKGKWSNLKELPRPY